MQVTVEIPEIIARKLAQKNPDVSHGVLEATVIEAVRDGVISAGKAAETLDVSRYEIDGILKRAGVYLGYTAEDLERDRETHRLMGL
jgi:predicted HTH domain antitoxin